MTKAWKSLLESPPLVWGAFMTAVGYAMAVAVTHPTFLYGTIGL